MLEFDVAVIGGGLVGASIAWGLARSGQRVAVFDEGDIAHRATRGNFALVWVQSKGLGLPGYARWSVESSNRWGAFADLLKQQTGLDVCHQRPGGFQLALSEAELAKRAAGLQRLHAQPGMPKVEVAMLDRAQVQRMLPQIGPQVAGGSYCALDGHVNVLRLFRALHAGMQQFGVKYLPARRVERIEPRDGGFRIDAAGASQSGPVSAAKVVLAAGLDNLRLAPQLGLAVPVRPQRGQLIVTEKTAPFLHYPVSTVRQTDEGGVMIGDSQEETGFDATLGMPVLSVMADRAQRMFPSIGALNVVRTWTALRVMTQDGFPIYEQSARCPGAFVATCHSGVTLAANHALVLAPLIAQGALPVEPYHIFSTRRFDVQATTRSG